MGFQQLEGPFSLKATVAIGYGVAVDIDANGQVALPAAGGRIAGVCVMKAAIGDACTFQNDGIAECKTGAGGVTQGTAVKVDAAGLMINAVATDKSVGIAVLTVAAGGFAPILLKTGLTVV